MSQVTIRTVRDDDLPKVHAVCVAAFEPVHAGFARALGPVLFAAHYSGWREAYAQTLREAASRHRLSVAEVDGAIAGFIVTDFDEARKVGEISLMAVDPTRQRQGTGHALVAHALDCLRARGATSAYVGTGGDDAHAPARAVYQAAGFAHAIPSIHFHRTL